MKKKLHKSYMLIFIGKIYTNFNNVVKNVISSLAVCIVRQWLDTDLVYEEKEKKVEEEDIAQHKKCRHWIDIILLVLLLPCIC